MSSVGTSPLTQEETPCPTPSCNNTVIPVATIAKLTMVALLCMAGMAEILIPCPLANIRNYILRMRWMIDHPVATPMERSIVASNGMKRANATPVTAQINKAQVRVLRLSA